MKVVDIILKIYSNVVLIGFSLFIFTFVIVGGNITVEVRVKPSGICSKCGAHQFLSNISCLHPDRCNGDILPIIYTDSKDDGSVVAKGKTFLNLFTDELLEELGFKLEYRKISKFSPFQEYGRAKSGMTTLSWNTEGAFCTYHGEPNKDNNIFYIGKDCDTRTAFNGYVFNQEDIRKVIKLTS